MGIGHVAVGLALKRAAPRTNAGWLIFAALLPDFLLGWFALAGMESYSLPPDYRSAHYLLFTFPWSHGLLADMGWSAVAGAAAWGLTKRRTVAVLAVAAVLSHFVLDGIVHVKGLPLLAPEGPAFGLGLWRHLPPELTIELLLAALGLWLYRSALKRAGANRWLGMVVYVAALAAFLTVGQVGATQPPPRGGLIAGWIAMPALIGAIAFWLDGRSERKIAAKI